MACEASLAVCNATLSSLAANYTELQAAYDACGCSAGGSGPGAPEDPCAADTPVDYSLGLHIAAVFIILAASALGAALPLVTRALHGGIVPYLIVLGKCMGIGVILACALVHMLLPANASLTSPCVPAAFNTDYSAYAYLFAMLAALAMHAFDHVLLSAMNKHVATSTSAADGSTRDLLSNVESGTSTTSAGQENGALPTPTRTPTPSKKHSGHVHAVLPMEAGIQKTIAAYMLEFGVTVHSIFIGLAVGVVGDTELTGLLVALSFHQFFEGIALGARLADARLPSHWHEATLAFVFAVSAPLGIGIGIAVASSLDPNSSTFLLVQGSFDAVCAGILLYIGFALLFHDFPEDMEAFCNGNKHDSWRRLGMFFCLWVGAGFMAFIGRYL